MIRKVIVTCSLPMNANDTALAVAHTSSGAETLAKKVRKVHVVSAFSTVPSEVLFDVFRRKNKTRTRRRPSLLYCGDDRHAKRIAARLIRDVGFESVDAGPPRIARCIEPRPIEGLGRFRLRCSHEITKSRRKKYISISCLRVFVAGRTAPCHHRSQRASPLAENLVRDARVRQGRQCRLLFPKCAEVQNEVRDVRLQ